MTKETEGSRSAQIAARLAATSGLSAADAVDLAWLLDQRRELLTRVIAAAEIRAWDEGRVAGYRDGSKIASAPVGRAVVESVNPYRADSA